MPEHTFPSVKHAGCSVMTLASDGTGTLLHHGERERAITRIIQPHNNNPTPVVGQQRSFPG